MDTLLSIAEVASTAVGFDTLVQFIIRQFIAEGATTAAEPIEGEVAGINLSN